jgi:hypothetical protein
MVKNVIFYLNLNRSQFPGSQEITRAVNGNYFRIARSQTNEPGPRAACDLLVKGWPALSVTACLLHIAVGHLRLGQLGFISSA